MIVATVERLKSVFVLAVYNRTHCIPTIHVPNKFNNAFVYRHIGVNALNVENAFKCNTLSNVMSVLVELVNFTMVKFEYFYKNSLIAM